MYIGRILQAVPNKPEEQFFCNQAKIELQSQRRFLKLKHACPYMTSDAREEGDSAQSDFISEEALIKKLMRR